MRTRRFDSSATVDALNTSSHYLYLGHDEKFDMALFSMQTLGSVGRLIWEYSTTGGSWTIFQPTYDRLTTDGSAYGFDKDGGEIFLDNLTPGLYLF